jgi:phosphoglycolate phosphatase
MSPLPSQPLYNERGAPSKMDKPTLYSHIERKVANLKRPAIIGINGAITSGKTMMSHELDRHLKDRGYPTQLIHMDDFHNARSIRMGGNSPECYFENAIDTQRLGELITDIKRGPVNKTMTLLDMGTDTYTNSKSYITNIDTVVIVEGVLLYRQSIKRLFDFKIYLDVDYNEILRRGKERDVPLYGESIIQQYIDLYIPVQKIYASRCSPKEQSDLVVNNNNFCEPVIAE